jgi:hypothetical protein
MLIELPKEPLRRSRMDSDPRPYARWWWFANPIDPRDIDLQVAWCAANGFGGVEIAWVYPLPGKGPGPIFLSREWTALVVHARDACQAAGIGCDFTFGSMWPFGGSFVEDRDVSLSWQGPTGQILDRSWETAYSREPCRVINHLSVASLQRYAAVMASALAHALLPPTGVPGNAALEFHASAATARETASCLFCDSWEVEGAGLWTPGFGEEFKERFGYDVLPFMANLDDHPEARYDYRCLLAVYAMREFYVPYVRICHELGAAARVQCHGAPTDILAAYAAMDVPESESVLFPPEFSSIAASAALLTGKTTVSAEAFTCLYGWEPWPAHGPHRGEEKIEDVRLTADALFASGINHLVWHGMPFQSAGEAARFYATVHVGPDAAMADRFASFNAYLSDMSGRMKQGVTYARVACYLPWEDALVAGALPPELRLPSAAHFWELHHTQRPAEARPYCPAWISAAFFRDAVVEKGRLRVGAARFEALFIDSQWMDCDALRAIVRFVEQGLPVVLKQSPREPGRRSSADYGRLLEALTSHRGVYPSLAGVPGLLPVLRPTRTADALPPFWVRRDGEHYTIFFAHPCAADVRYPLSYGFATEAKSTELRFRLSLGTMERELLLSYHGAGALLVTIEGGSLDCMDTSSLVRDV